MMEEQQQTTQTVDDAPSESGSDDLRLRKEVVAALKCVFDPEIPVSIYELGLIYDIDISDSGIVNIRMTLTSPSCPEAGILPGKAEDYVRAVPGVMDCHVELVWEPTWHMGLMSEAAKLELNL